MEKLGGRLAGGRIEDSCIWLISVDEKNMEILSKTRAGYNFS